MLSGRQGVGIDIGDDALRVVTVRMSGAGFEVRHAASLPRQDEDAPEEAVAALATMLPPAGVAHARVAGALPASGCTFKTASLPPSKPAELLQVIRFEAENQFPLPLPELVWGYELTPDANGRWHAVIAGARRGLVDDRLALLNGAQTVPVALQPAPIATARAVQLPDGPYLLIVAGAEWSDLCHYNGERLLGCRSVMAGAPGVDGWAERIAREVRPWLAGADEECEIVLVGTVTPATAAMLAAVVDVPVRVGELRRDLYDPQKYLQGNENFPALATALGLALVALDREQAINLLPAPMLEQRKIQRKQGWVLAALLMLAVLLLPAVQWCYGQYDMQQQAYQQVMQSVSKRENARPSRIAAGVTPAMKLLSALNGADSKPLEILRLMSATMPKGIILTDFAYDRGKMVVMKGRATTNAVLADAVAAVQKTAVFERVMLDFATLAREDDGHPGYDFQLTCPLPVSSDPMLGSGKRARKGSAIR